jgi:hypothetical protein
MGVQNCIRKIDSKVIAAQIEKECITRDITQEKYLALIRRMENYFNGFSIEHIERNKNIEANKLAKATAGIAALPPDVFFQTIEDSSVKTIELEPRMVNIIQGEDQRVPIMAYLQYHYEPDNITNFSGCSKGGNHTRLLVALYTRPPTQAPLLHCLSKAKGQQPLSEICVGIYGGHTGSRALAAKIFR